MATRIIPVICLFGLILPITTWAQSGRKVEIHYAPRENLESVDVQEIGRAELSIYVLSDTQIIEALTDAAERDVTIRVYLEFARAGTCSRGTR